MEGTEEITVMSYTTTQLTSIVTGLSKSIADLDAQIASELRTLWTANNAQRARIEGIETVNKQQWDSIGTRAVAADVWRKFDELNTKIRQLDAKNAAQDASIKDNHDWINEVNSRLSGQAIELGKSSGGGILGGLGTGLGISLPMIAVGVGAFFLLTRRR